MKNNLKKVALVLVLALTLAIAIPVLAAEQTVITGTYQDIAIDVKLPSSSNTAIVNPYALPVEIKTDGSKTVAATSLGKLETGGQIASMPLVGCNLGEFDLNVTATVSGEAKGDFKLAATTADVTAATTAGTKTGLVFFQLKNADYDIGLDAEPSTSIGGFNGANVMYVYKDWAKVTSPDADKDIVVGKTATPTPDDGIVTIKAAQAGVADPTTLVPQADSYFVARLSGNIVKAPKDAWKSRDGFVATIVWNIEPTPAP